MPYNLEKMNSLNGLEKISLVMDYIMTRAEINGLLPSITLEENISVAGVEKQDFEDIIYHLLKENILKNKETIWYEEVGQEDYKYTQSTNGSSYYVAINYDEFNKFQKKLINRINKLKFATGNKDKLIDENITGVSFDEDSGVLSIGNYSINIDLKNKKSFSHDVLFFLKRDFSKEADYFDIAEYIDGIDKTRYYKEKYYLKIYRACKDIQEKIKEQTKHKIEDFLTFNCSERGNVKINKKYL